MQIYSIWQGAYSLSKTGEGWRNKLLKRRSTAAATANNLFAIMHMTICLEAVKLKGKFFEIYTCQMISCWLLFLHGESLAGKKPLVVTTNLDIYAHHTCTPIIKGLNVYALFLLHSLLYSCSTRWQ